MSIELRRPQFSGTDREKLQQMHSYIYQLVDQLQYAFSTVETSGGGDVTTVIQQTVTSPSGENRPATPEDAEATFAAIKNLIIKSGDIVDAYYEEINERLISSNEYVMYNGDNGFNKFREKTVTDITKNSENITIEQNKLQSLSNVFQNEEQAAYIKKSTGYIKAGFLSGDDYGVEVGQRQTDSEGRETLVGSARFTPGKIAFYDDIAYTEGTPTPSTYLSKKRLNTTEVEVGDIFINGGFMDDSDDSGNIVTKWVGRER